MTKRVFLSHSSAHATKAKEIDELFSGIGGGRLKIFRSELLPAGQRWFDELQSELAKADVLILLLFESAIDWDWCKYEAGFFAGNKKVAGLGGSLIVLNAEGVAVPKPLSHYQNVLVNRSSEEQVLAFVRALFECDSSEPIHPELNKKPAILQGVCDELIQHFLVEHAPVLTAFDKRIRLRFTKKQVEDLQKHWKVPDEVVVKGDYGALQLFGIDQPFSQVTLGQLCSVLAAAGENELAQEALRVWPLQLGRILKIACEFARGNHGFKMSDGLPLYFEPYHRVTYRPSLYERTWLPSEGSMEFRINFTQLPEELSTRPPNKLGIISHLLDLCRMFRWGVLESEMFRPLRDGTAEKWSELKKHELLDRLRLAFNNIRCDFLNRGFKIEEIEKAFESKGVFARNDRARIAALLELGQSLKENLDQACETADFEAIKKLFIDYDQMNREFFDLILRHYKKHINRLKI